ncbi:MAG: futalosine hydrolase, partial [Pseudonocardiales bacterium]|nr:futalosine hydrolase [Pseudonocardiales bacterium]
MTLLVVTAVVAERDAIVAACSGGPDVQGAPAPLPGTRVMVGGVGPAAAAAAASAALAEGGIDLVLCAGVGGGFAPLGIGEVAVASCAVFADLGAETADGFAPVSTLGFGTERYEVAPRLAVEL